MQQKTINCNNTKTPNVRRWWLNIKYNSMAKVYFCHTWASIERIPTTAMKAATVSDEKPMTWGWESVQITQVKTRHDKHSQTQAPISNTKPSPISHRTQWKEGVCLRLFVNVLFTKSASLFPPLVFSGVFRSNMQHQEWGSWCEVCIIYANECRERYMIKQLPHKGDRKVCRVMLAPTLTTNYFAVFFKMVAEKYEAVCVRLARLVHLTLFTQTIHNSSSLEKEITPCRFISKLPAASRCYCTTA